MSLFVFVCVLNVACRNLACACQSQTGKKYAYCVCVLAFHTL